MNYDNSDWLKEVRTLVADIAPVFLSVAEFETAIRRLVGGSAPLDALRFQFSGADNLDPLEVTAGDVITHRENLNTVSHRLSGEGKIDCRISVHINADARWCVDDPTETLRELHALADSFWKGQTRDDKSRLPALQGGHAIGLAEATMNRALRLHGAVSCLFCDLDNFKAVNDRINMAKGDNVIRQMAGILQGIANPHAIALHRSGDEFVLLLPTGDQNDALELGIGLLAAVKSHDFGTGDIPVGLSAGIVHVWREERELSYQTLEQLAEKAVKLPNGSKRRGKVTLRSSSERHSFPPIGKDETNRAICIVKGNPGNVSPFESPFLNVLSRRVTAIAVDEKFRWDRIAARVKDLVALLAPEFAPEVLRCSEAATQSWDGRSLVSALDLAFALARGLLVAGIKAGREQVEHKTLSIRMNLADESHVRLVLSPDDHTILEIPHPCSSTAAVDLGGFLCVNRADDIDPNAAQRALLIKIGHGSLEIPNALFAAVLIVDDRPTRGGELRDFWESVIARLVAIVCSNPNVEKVYVVGDERFARESVRRLQSLDRWKDEADYMSFKTGAKASDITTAAQRLIGKIEFLTNESELLDRLAAFLKDEVLLPPLRQVSSLRADNRFLRRLLEIGDVALTKHDGCRVSTIAKAFPIVVEIARTAEEDELIRDQAGELLYELVDFKVHLTKPLQDRIPAFYRREEASLNEYLRRAFLDEGALFGSRITDGRQLDTVLQHVAGAIRNPHKRFATRRGILVLPNVVSPTAELAPLGLVSIRIIPRFNGYKSVLHYSFTWRTVETLVGFPYSIFGSVGYAEHLTNSIRGILGPGMADSVETGELSYFAHSLHIFRDDYGQHIARRIVDDASL